MLDKVYSPKDFIEAGYGSKPSVQRVFHHPEAKVYTLSSARNAKQRMTLKEFIRISELIASEC